MNVDEPYLQQGIGLQAIPPGATQQQLQDFQGGSSARMLHAGNDGISPSSGAEASHANAGAGVGSSTAYSEHGSGWDPDSVTLGRKVMADFLRTARAYDIVPESNKVVVFDTAVPIRLAFYALVEHDTACAPLWDGERCAFSGLLTTSDIVDIMRVFYTPGSGAPASQALSELTISAWRSFAGSVEGLTRGLSSPDFQRASDAMIAAAKMRAEAASASSGSSPDASGKGVGAAGLLSPLYPGGQEGGPGATAIQQQQQQQDDGMGSHGPDKVSTLEAVALRRAHRVHRRLIAIDPEEDLLSVCTKLRKYHIHHMPVLDAEQAAIICILSHRHLLQHVVNRFADSRRLFDVPLYVLGVGSFDGVVVVPTGASVISVLNVLAERRISAVPLVNEAGQVVDVYSRDDVTFLAHDPSLMVLDAPVGEVRRAQVSMMGPSTPLVTCDKMDSLHRALELFGATGGRCERLVCVDEHRRCTGVVSLSDIFSFFASREPVRLRPGWEDLPGASVGPGTAGQGGGGHDGLGLSVDAAMSGNFAMEI